jgi:pimeloyl-ACP methyl ester carboxylesterase
VKLDQMSLRAKTWGKGETVILLPGTGADTSWFEGIARGIAAAGFQVIAVNPRGIAGSTGTLEGLTLHDYARDIALLIEKLGVSRVHLLGWAGGNRMARCLAADRPDLIQSVTLLAAGGKVPPEKQAGEALTRLLGDDRKMSSRERLELSRQLLFSPKSGAAEGFKLPRSWPEATKSQAKALETAALDDWWSGGSAPMLVIQGLDDRVAPPSNGRALKEAYGERVRLVELQAAGHALLLEQPKAIVNAVVSFLREFAILTPLKK